MSPWPHLAAIQNAFKPSWSYLLMSIILFSNISRTNGSLYKTFQLQNLAPKRVINLPALSRSYLQGESETSFKVDIIVKDAAKVNEVVCVYSLYSVANLFLKFRQVILIMIATVDVRVLLLRGWPGIVHGLIKVANVAFLTFTACQEGCQAVGLLVGRRIIGIWPVGDMAVFILFCDAHTDLTVAAMAPPATASTAATGTIIRSVIQVDLDVVDS